MLNKLITEPIHLVMVIGLYCILYHIFSECKYLFYFFLARSEYRIREAEPPTNYFIYENIFLFFIKNRQKDKNLSIYRFEIFLKKLQVVGVH